MHGSNTLRVISTKIKSKWTSGPFINKSKMICFVLSCMGIWLTCTTILAKCIYFWVTLPVYLQVFPPKIISTSCIFYTTFILREIFQIEGYIFQPGIRASCLTPNGKIIDTYYDDARTTHEAFIRGVKLSSKSIFVNNQKHTVYL